MRKLLTSPFGFHFVFAALLALLSAESVDAKSPMMIASGKQLFEKDWSPLNPVLGRDGLGPLFNARSCVACHHQGGMGGGGDARFNSKTVGIDQMKVTGGASPVGNDEVRRAISGFHPGFVGPKGVILNTFAVSHHGGSPQFASSRQALMKSLPTEFSEHGGPVSAAEVRHANATPILYNTKLGTHNVAIRARLYQRNTPAIFGAGLIDQVTGKQLEIIRRAQLKHPEISGRPGTLENGRIGRFGWRANIPTLLDFCDQACANELGLKTKRLNQPIDPMQRHYKNPSADISDDQLKAMTAFMAALPAPERRMPEDSAERERVLHGERVFAQVGCAVCHVPTVGPAEGLYSDLLLHDMGRASMDLNRAEPYIKRISVVSRVAVTGETVTTTRRTNMTGYYSGSTEMTTTSKSGNPKGLNRSGRSSGNDRSYYFSAPTRPERQTKFVSLGSRSGTLAPKTTTKTENETVSFRNRNGSLRGNSNAETTTTSTRVRSVTAEQAKRIDFESTNFNQEWRTPPLWGVADSAPYLHDGRADTLLEAITLHDGEAAGTRDRFLALPLADRYALVAFLETMVAPSTAPKPAL